MRATYPEKISHRAPVIHDKWPPRFLQFLNDSKWIMVIISSLEYQIDLILHILVELNIAEELEAN